MFSSTSSWLVYATTSSFGSHLVSIRILCDASSFFPFHYFPPNTNRFAVVAFRKTVLVAMPVFFPAQILMQLVAASAVVSAMLAVHVASQPFIETTVGTANCRCLSPSQTYPNQHITLHKSININKAWFALPVGHLIPIPTSDHLETFSLVCSMSLFYAGWKAVSCSCCFLTLLISPPPFPIRSHLLCPA